MKLNPNQLGVLKSIANVKKASYYEAIAAGGNGRTLEFLVKNNLVVREQHPKKGNLFSLTEAGKLAVKADKAAKAKAAKAAEKLATV